MSDLAAMLSDLHDDPPADLPHRHADPAPDPVRMKLPDWASEEALDAAFANWVPGPPVESSQAERSLFSDLTELADRPLSVDAPLSGDVPTDAEEPPAAEVTSGTAMIGGAPAAPAAPASAATVSPTVMPAPAPASIPSFGPRPTPTVRETPMTELMRGAKARSDDDLLPKGAKRRRWFRR